MKALVVKILAGLVLFAGSLVGGLAATGRLNHEGTANIPLLGALFPAPPAPEGDPAHGDEAHGDAAHAAPGEAADAAHRGAAAPVDAAHDGKAQDPQKPAEPTGPLKSKVGKSVVKPEPPPATDGHGGGEHGAPDPHGGGEAAEHKGEHGDEKPKAPQGHGGEHAAEADMLRIQTSLATDVKNKYAPGGFFRFDGMPAGLTPEQINEAWQRVQGVLTDIERRKTALDLREQELQELADDISRRQHELGRERTKIEERHRELDARIQKFQDQVKLVRNDEVAALKRNAETLASFEAEKAAQLVLDQWKTDRGQDEVLRTFEFMDKDAVNTILNALPGPMVQDILKKRLRVSKETVPTAPGK